MEASNTPSEPDTIDLFSRCLGCGHEFESGDERLRFSLQEFGDHFGLQRFPGVDMFDIGLCAECIQAGDFKTPEVVL